MVANRPQHSSTLLIIAQCQFIRKALNGANGAAAREGSRDGSQCDGSCDGSPHSPDSGDAAGRPDGGSGSEETADDGAGSQSHQPTYSPLASTASHQKYPFHTDPSRVRGPQPYQVCQV